MSCFSLAVFLLPVGSVFNTWSLISPNLCRSAFMTKEADEELEGVSTLKYNVPKEVFNVSFEENKGFCTEDGPCTNGLLDASACYSKIIQLMLCFVKLGDFSEIGF